MRGLAVTGFLAGKNPSPWAGTGVEGVFSIRWRAASVYMPALLWSRRMSTIAEQSLGGALILKAVYSLALALAAFLSPRFVLRSSTILW